MEYSANQNTDELDFWVIKSDEQRANVIDHIIRVITPDPEKPWSVKIQPYSEKRRDAQNRLAHKWFAEVSKQGREYTPFEIKQRAKLRYGIPILLLDEVFAAYWGKVLPMFPIYEEQCEELMPNTPVTSLMNVKQMAQFLSDFQGEACRKYQLTDPSMYGLEEMAKRAG